MSLKSVVFFLMMLLVASGSTFAQQNNTAEEPDSLFKAWVPALGYSSNQGMIGGGIYSRYDYRGGIKPFRNYFKASALVSVKGYVNVDGTYERTRNFGRRIRSALNVHFRRMTTNNFFGIGNEIPFDESQWEDEFYYFESVGFGASYDLKILIHMDDRRHLDLLAGVETEYQIPYIKYRPSSFEQQMPLGHEGGWMNFVKTGLLWENRDREFDPRKGNRAVLEFRYAPDLISKYGMGTARVELRQYFLLFDELKIANRLEAHHAFGDVPFWELSTLGDDNTLRGYPLNRYQGNSSVAYTLELRSWLFEFPQFYRMKLGLHFFTDMGRVFSGRDDFKDLFRGYKQTVGFGGAMSVLSPDFILRGDIGFSEDMSRIYVGVGYLF